MDEELQRRKENVINFLKEKKEWIVYVILAAIIWLSLYIRTKNVPLLKDAITGNYVPISMDDPNVFLRYASYVLEHGKLMAVDTLRYHPFGFTGLQEFSFLSHFIVYLYKFLHIFDSGVTIEYATIIYPPITTAIALVFFFLLVRKLFNYQVALVSTAFLVVIPAFLFRTISGFSDKEALGVLLMFMALYFFVYSWKEEKLTKSLITAILAGLSTGVMGIVWGGVSFVFLTISLFTLIVLFLNKFNEREFFVYILWFFSSFLVSMIFFPSKFNIGNLLTSLSVIVPLFVLLLVGVNYFVFTKKIVNIKLNLPNVVTSFIIAIILGMIILFIQQGPSFLINEIIDMYTHLSKPFATGRWVVTVAESHQPYLTDWFGQFGKTYVWLMLIGSVILFHQTIKVVAKKDTWKLTLIYIIFAWSFIFSRYSQNSTFNGVTTISQITYIGSLILFGLILLYLYFKVFYKDKQRFGDLKEINEFFIFSLIWFFIMVVAARSAIRLLFIFAPITTIIFTYFFYSLYEISMKNIKENLLKIFAVLVIILIVALIFISQYKIVSQQAKYAGTGNNQQWQAAGKWIRENTQENAVFAHWWDYGYWVQTFGERATISDGGNARGAINFFVGRHVLTAQNDTEALELLKANNVTNLLIVSEEIGKYPAFSSIGSDENYDRYSWITTFSLDSENVRETRNGTSYLYRGGTVLDEDLIYDGKLYPRREAGIGAFFVEVQSLKDENGTVNGLRFMQPKGVLVYNGQQLEVPINCIFFNDQEILFNNTKGIDGCLRIIPTISNNQINPVGATLYLSPRVKRTLFTRLYLFNEQNKYFKSVYNDEAQIPLAVYNGALIGPIKIWSVTYPNNLVIPKEYYGTTVPNPEVDMINPLYS
ncbi:MAG: STT3 domain-containing protein [archaeon]